ncbi:diadenylate cyclase CdaA [Entomospira culicis]|uniref:Diadenylate cyclase n=1 Tax=Entomospira culicis TaxID=2719989 RepID=A0A968KV44_9SPIO|nr:diadenylate cyclase CdaA [Entomospira culicis]NIZ18507.1 TIGR00159 family protein [Entomospira culicis]NIZ68723.1 TIGR00159 family protein [Entomospira culicis]WDI37320.1 diadenylate cyclase CdaA [Entomospira culicis]WDI38949.1 diadenylate cyclase CdaA [Entomospira culicis]
MDSWLNETLFFRNFLRPLLDIGILSAIFYYFYRYVLRSYGQSLFRGIRGPLAIFLVAYLFQLETLLWIYRLISPFLIIAVALIFQPELRKMLAKIGRQGWSRREQEASAEKVDMIFTSLASLAEQRRGALVVFTRTLTLRDIADTGTRLEAEVSGALLTTIFAHDTLLHDGAVIIHHGRIMAAGCFLPLSKQDNLRKSFGTRHRAALGVSEESDALVLIVSEESGAISLAVEGVLYYDRKVDELKNLVRSLLQNQANEDDFRNFFVERLE